MLEAMIKLRGNTTMNMIVVSAITIHEELVLLLLFVCHQDLDGVPVVVRWRIRVCDPDIEDRRRSATPEAVGRHVALVLPSPIARTCKSGPEWISGSSKTMTGVKA